jgi:uncharacterized protein (DUF58 family)
LSADEPLHTPFSRGLLLLAMGVGACGLALGNPVFLLLAATIVVVLHAARSGWPGNGSLTMELGADRVQRGQRVEARLAAAMAPGPYGALVHLALPGSLTLEEGSNLALVPPGGAVAERVRVGCPKRGPFLVGPATLTALHPHLLAPAAPLGWVAAAPLVVEPRLRPLRRAKQIRGRAHVAYGEDRGLRGVGSSEFRELREYAKGDPLKAVNWKATAKRSTDKLELMVNQFEPEARKNVWFFLDVSDQMEVGTTLENCLEEAIEAALALAHHFLSRGHRVGGTTYNTAAPLVFYPDTGTRQQLTIARGLAHAEPGDAEEGLLAAAERVRGFLAREKPLTFVLTRPELDPDGLAAGARRVQRYAPAGRPRPVFVLAPQPAGAGVAEDLGRALQALEVRALVGSSPVIRIVPLRHGLQSLDLALAKGVLAR